MHSNGESRLTIEKGQFMDDMENWCPKVHMGKIIGAFHQGTKTDECLQAWGRLNTMVAPA
uniref:Uncharacterized protein n=1 Tax=Fagus sylvatica TaxID=28930 RepID=A0A2N9GUG1_FAGSY